MHHVELALSPTGHLYLHEHPLVEGGLSGQAYNALVPLFGDSAGDQAAALFELGLMEFSCPLPPSFLYWQLFSRRFISALFNCSNECYEPQLTIPSPTAEELQRLCQEAFPFYGVEYLCQELLSDFWLALEHVARRRLAIKRQSPREFLHEKNPRWSAVGRICFHLAENKKDEERPFSFLATYSTRLSSSATPQHLPLKKALQQYAGPEHRKQLLDLLLPIQTAAEKSPFLKKLMGSGEVFQLHHWDAVNTHRFLKEIPLMEESGIIVKVPNWWTPERPPRPKINVTLGQSGAQSIGMDGLLDFDIVVCLGEGVTLSDEEWRVLMGGGDPLVKIKEQWVEVDREKLSQLLGQWQKLKSASQNGLTIGESMRLMAAGGSTLFSNNGENFDEESCEWSNVTAGTWLRATLEKLKNPASCEERVVEQLLADRLRAELRPYQRNGVKWLWFLYQLGLGGCLADDMGLGKTMQLLSLLLLIKYHPDTADRKRSSLLVLPASLVGNWVCEANRFAPSLKVLVAHSSYSAGKLLQELDEPIIDEYDLVITTYGNLYRFDWISAYSWETAILDEAQMIKNPQTKQTRAAKKLTAKVRYTLTGTPVENRLGDLWSLFDFTLPGLLGGHKAFNGYLKEASKDPSSKHYSHFIATLRGITQPYILRRLKSDKAIIKDLPDKIEMKSYCTLATDQIKLYQQAIDELKESLATSSGIEKKGLILSYILRFKQICNHPTQWLGYGSYDEELSGKFTRLRELCEEIAAKQEKVLVFTQFKEIIPHLANFLAEIFGRPGLVLHGSVAVRERQQLVEAFQQEQGPPFFLLSIKAGGTGLTLTRAKHVIHFDRWWNPAVENQATDRAYRIGQKSTVLVHKFVTMGTIEEKIDAMIAAKKKLSDDTLQGEQEIALTEMNDEELLDLFSLNLDKVYNTIK